MKRILCTGAGGFIGYHLTAYLKRQGHFVVGVDIKRPEFEPTAADEFVIMDLRHRRSAMSIPVSNHDRISLIMNGIDEVYALAADMGGMGFISCHHAEILYNNLMINLNTFDAARLSNVKRALFASSACVYPEFLQKMTGDSSGLKEKDAFPAEPQDAYGWEKLTTERLVRHYREEYKIETRIARFHNVFGPYGSWRGGREKAPAALCRKIAEAKLAGIHEIDIWGDGEQLRSFCYIDDCIEGLVRLMDSEYHEPVNIGQDRAVTINMLAHMIAAIVNWPISLRHIEGPQGVRSRNSDNSLAKHVLKGWEPKITLEEGLRRTYHWIEKQVMINGHSTNYSGNERLASDAHS